MTSEDSPEVTKAIEIVNSLKSISISGFASQASGFADTFVISKLFEKVY